MFKYICLFIIYMSHLDVNLVNINAYNYYWQGNLVNPENTGDQVTGPTGPGGLGGTHWTYWCKC